VVIVRERQTVNAVSTMGKRQMGKLTLGVSDNTASDAPLIA
jgi:hypothetical protein